MKSYRTTYKNKKFSKERIELDGNSFINCIFEGCIIILENGDTDLRGSAFKNCELMLRGNAYTIAKIIKMFSGKSPLKVVDLDEPLLEKQSIE
ncbi:MAG: hypothetical protein JXB50_16230 [Spirochaetes bacterium]|nr:hypothetical protein [Spirochaetota bacterium]